MKISHLKISYFRSIKKAQFEVDDINAIVGANNTGKSAILRALNAFFNYSEERNSFIAGEHLYSKRAKSRIEITFVDLPKDRRFTKYTDGEKLTIELSFSKTNNKRELRYKKGRNYLALDRNLLGPIRRYIRYVFIPPNRDKTKFQWEEETLLKELVTSYLKQKSSKKDFFSRQFVEAAENLNARGLEKLTKDFSKNYILSDGIKLNIGFSKNLNYTDFLNNIYLSVEEKDSTFRLSHCGNGIQSLAIISLHLHLARLQNGKVIVGLEEPETNLHPQAQIELIRSLTVAMSDIGQFLFTTHSPSLLDHIEHEKVIMVRKIDDPTRGFYTDISKLGKDFFARNDIEELQYNQFHRFRNSDFFYSKGIILVESTIDAQIVAEIAKKLNVDINLTGVSIIHLDGVSNIKYPIYLLKELKIPFWTILDKDFFIPYLNDELIPSRNTNGFPKYRYEYRQNTKAVVDFLIPKKDKREKLIKLFKTNHSQAMNLLEEFNIICMNYSIELDLLSSKKAQEFMYTQLRVGENNKNINELTENRYNQIKKAKHLIPVLRKLPVANLPNSYKKIKNVLKDKILK